MLIFSMNHRSEYDCGIVNHPTWSKRTTPNKEIKYGPNTARELRTDHVLRLALLYA
jgi:hypothetical protein